MPYIDGYLTPVPAANRDRFLAVAQRFDKLLMDHGALRVVECWADDVKHGQHTDFFRAVAAGDDETVVFSWVEWPDKATRDAAQARMDEQIKSGELAMPDMPFDGRRMIYGGFAPFIDLTKI